MSSDSTALLCLTIHCFYIVTVITFSHIRHCKVMGVIRNTFCYPFIQDILQNHPFFVVINIVWCFTASSDLAKMDSNFLPTCHKAMLIIKEVEIVYRLFLVNCYLLHVPRIPSQPASSGRGWVIEKNWLERAWQYIAMTRNNLSIIWISLFRITHSA